MGPVIFGPGPVRNKFWVRVPVKNILVTVSVQKKHFGRGPVQKKFWCWSYLKSFGPGPGPGQKKILVPVLVPVKKKVLVPVPVKKKNLVLVPAGPGPGPLCSSLDKREQDDYLTKVDGI